MPTKAKGELLRFVFDNFYFSKTVDFEIMEHPNFYDWTVEERNYMAIREQAFRITQHYGWTMEGGRIDFG